MMLLRLALLALPLRAAGPAAAPPQAFIRFLQDYQREPANAKQELAVLRAWFDKKSDLTAQ